MIKYNFYYWGPLLFKTKLPEEVLQKIKKLCKKDPDKSYVKNLAGDIKDEYAINEIEIDNIIKPYINTFREAFLNWYGSSIGELYARGAWVNYMKPGDYNPVHIHRDCEFSSVLYLDIPEELKKEMESFKGRGKGPGSISFLYGEESYYATTWYDFRPEVGDFYIFPWALRHYVHPYKSKCERISVAINFGVRPITSTLLKQITGETEDEKYLEELKTKL